MRRILAAAALTLAACGYSPLYAPSEGAAKAASHVQIGRVAMVNMEVDVGQRRVAQTVAQRLQLDFPNTGPDFDTLTVDIEETTSTLAMERTSALRRAQINLTGHLEIIGGDGKTLFRTGISTATAYNVEASPYSTESGKSFARITAARNLAEDISHRVAIFYRTRGK